MSELNQFSPEEVAKVDESRQAYEQKNQYQVDRLEKIKSYWGERQSASSHQELTTIDLAHIDAVVEDLNHEYQKKQERGEVQAETPSLKQFIEDKYGLKVQGSDVPDFVRIQLMKDGLLPLKGEDFAVSAANLKPVELNLLFSSGTYWSPVLPGGIESAMIRDYFRSIGGKVVTGAVGDPGQSSWTPDNIVCQVINSKNEQQYFSAYSTATGVDKSEISFYSTSKKAFEEAEASIVEGMDRTGDLGDPDMTAAQESQDVEAYKKLRDRRMELADHEAIYKLQMAKKK